MLRPNGTPRGMPDTHDCPTAYELLEADNRRLREEIVVLNKALECACEVFSAGRPMKDGRDSLETYVAHFYEQARAALEEA